MTEGEDCPFSGLDNWGVCMLLPDDTEPGLDPPRGFDGNQNGLTYINTAITSASDGGYKFVNDAGDDFIASGNGCPLIQWNANWVLKMQARLVSNFAVVQFESAEFPATTFSGNGATNPFTVMGDNIYNTNQLGIYNRDSMATFATSAGSTGQCVRNNNGANQGSTICFGNGVSTLSISANVNRQTSRGIYMCNVNSWCGGGANGYIMVALVQYRG
jgi:hypothetical protein